MILSKAQRDEFEALALPMIQFLKNNFHPHVTVVVSVGNAEILEGVLNVTTPTGQETDTTTYSYGRTNPEDWG